MSERNLARAAEGVVAVIGAGPSGLATMKNLITRGIPAVCYEAHSDLGGIWNLSNPKSSAYRNTHTITSRHVTAFEDFPMPRDFPVYPRHDQVLEYLRAYANKHGLTSSVRCNSSVERMERLPRGGWRIILADGTTCDHPSVVIANGHNWYPNQPELPGHFEGDVLHSRDYVDAVPFAGKRVLVIGAGNSGCDIAVECAQVATRAALSMRRGYNFYPKFILGWPADQVGPFVRSLRMPQRLTSWVMKTLLRLTVGRPSDFGLPAPDHRPLETPAIINSLVPYYAAHGRIDIRTGVAKIEGRRVTFTDGKEQEFDTIVCATGFSIHIPFIEPKLLDWVKSRPNFYLYGFSPRFDDLFIAGMTDSTGGHFPTVDLQSKVIAAYLSAKEKNPEIKRKFDELKAADGVDLTGGIRFMDIPRNATQFALAAFKGALVEHLALLNGEPMQKRRPPSRLKIIRTALAARS